MSPGARPTSRRRSREAALQVLYAVDLPRRDPRARATRAAEAFETAAAHLELPAGAHAFAKELVAGVSAEIEPLDQRIGALSSHWRVERMAAVDRNVLRLAAWELLHTGTPPEVVIDEAVELARRFGGERSPGFVNGILDALARELRESGP